MKYEEIIEILLNQKKYIEKTNDYIPREIDFKKYLKSKEIVVITGARRTGKSYLLLQFIKKLDNWAYVNFEDKKFMSFTENDFDKLLKAIFYVYGNTKNLFFDEIQNIDNWEIYIRNLYEEKKNIYITGSNARLLSSELGTHLTGRHIDIKLLPFSFKEYLHFKDFKLKKYYNTEEKTKLLKYFKNFVENGSYPQYLESKDTQILETIYNDIIYRDLLPRYKIENIRILKDIILYLSTNLSKEISYNNIAKILNIKSVNTVKKYIDGLVNTNLIYLLPMFSESNKKILINPKKLYFVDNGIRNLLVFKRYLDKGNLIENIVYLELLRRNYKLFYFKDKIECDFLAISNNKKIKAIQVTYEINNKNKEREINGLLKCMEHLKLNIGYILTYEQKKNIYIKNKKIKVLPIYEWLLL